MFARYRLRNVLEARRLQQPEQICWQCALELLVLCDLRASTPHHTAKARKLERRGCSTRGLTATRSAQIEVSTCSTTGNAAIECDITPAARGSETHKPAPNLLEASPVHSSTRRHGEASTSALELLDRRSSHSIRNSRPRSHSSFSEKHSQWRESISNEKPVRLQGVLTAIEQSGVPEWWQKQTRGSDSILKQNSKYYRLSLTHVNPSRASRWTPLPSPKHRRSNRLTLQFSRALATVAGHTTPSIQSRPEIGESMPFVMPRGEEDARTHLARWRASQRKSDGGLDSLEGKAISHSEGTLDGAPQSGENVEEDVSETDDLDSEGKTTGRDSAVDMILSPEPGLRPGDLVSFNL